MHLMQEQNDACDARMTFFFFVHGWSLQSSSLIKSWVQNRVFTQPRSNESIKLELPGAWESTCNRSPLSSCEGKSSQGFVFDGNKTISRGDVTDPG